MVDLGKGLKNLRSPMKCQSLITNLNGGKATNMKQIYIKYGN